MYVRAFLAAVALATLIVACGGGGALEVNLGGDTTREDASRNSFGLPASELTREERRIFERGDSFFTQNWVIAPASTDARDGLGPLFNAPACASCHVLDGRGFPPDPEGERARVGLLLRLAIPGSDPVTGGPLPDPVYGGQLQDRAIPGVPVEGTIGLSYEIITGTYGEGTSYELRMPTYTVEDLGYGPLHPDIIVGARLAPQVIGLGLLEAIPEEDILALADPDDADGDGISGRPNYVWDIRREEPSLGRFGWKAEQPSVEQQVASAFHGDIGITSTLRRIENCTDAQPECREAIDGGDPEVTPERLEVVTVYSRTLSVPALRNAEDPQVRSGAELFTESGCASCHSGDYTTTVTDIDALSEQRIFPYTDLLLHDMGPGLDDGTEVFGASGAEWRTPPLWGIGLIDEVNGERFLLHDGRARTLEEAILWHGGEAEASKEFFRLMSAEDRAALIAFLESL